MRPSAVIAGLRSDLAEVRAENIHLRAELAAAGVEGVALPDPALRGLSPQGATLVRALRNAYPHAVDRYELLELIPGRDHAVLDRDVVLISVLVNTVRGKLGPDSIENVRGSGYRLGQALHATLTAKSQN